MRTPPNVWLAAPVAFALAAGAGAAWAGYALGQAHDPTELRYVGVTTTATHAWAAAPQHTPGRTVFVTTPGRTVTQRVTTAPHTVYVTQPGARVVVTTTVPGPAVVKPGPTVTVTVTVPAPAPGPTSS